MLFLPQIPQYKEHVGDQKKQDRPRMHRKKYNSELNIEERENIKAKAELQKRNDNAQSKKKKAALAHRDNNKKIQKQK